MGYKRLYTRGEHIPTLDQLVMQKFVFWNDKVTHCGWFMSWQLRMAAHAIGNNDHDRKKNYGNHVDLEW